VSFDVILDGVDKFWNAAEHSTADAFLRDLSEPSFDQIEPGRACRNEMDLKPWVLLQPCSNLRMFVCRIVVHDQMEIKLGGCLCVDQLEEFYPFLMAVPLHARPDDLALQQLKGSEQRCRTMALVVMGHRSASSFLDRKTWLCAIQSLNLTLLVHAEDQGILRRIHIEPHDVMQLLKEMLIVAQLEILDQMRLKAVGPPYAMHQCRINANLFRQRAGTPVSRVWGLTLGRLLNDALNKFCSFLRLSSCPGCILLDTSNALLSETTAPKRDGAEVDTYLGSDLNILHPFGCKQDNLGTFNDSGCCTAPFSKLLKPLLSKII